MKKRAGFVSNSSSSSFILGLRGDDATVTLSIVMDASKYGTLIETKEELDDFTLGEYGWKHTTVEELFQDESYLRERYEEALGHIESGGKVLWGSVSTGDDILEELLCDRGFPESDDYVVIQQTER